MKSNTFSIEKFHNATVILVFLMFSGQPSFDYKGKHFSIQKASHHSKIPLERDIKKTAGPITGTAGIMKKIFYNS